jgi:hypothetical protein
LFFSLSVVAKELKKRHRSRSLSLLPNPFWTRTQFYKQL